MSKIENNKLPILSPWRMLGVAVKVFVTCCLPLPKPAYKILYSTSALRNVFKPQFFCSFKIRSNGGEGIAEAYLLFKVTYALYYRIQELEEFLLNLESGIFIDDDDDSQEVASSLHQLFHLKRSRHIQSHSFNEKVNPNFIHWSSSIELFLLSRR